MNVGNAVDAVFHGLVAVAVDVDGADVEAFVAKFC